MNIRLAEKLRSRPNVPTNTKKEMCQDSHTKHISYILLSHKQNQGEVKSPEKT